MLTFGLLFRRDGFCLIILLPLLQFGDFGLKRFLVGLQLGKVARLLLNGLELGNVRGLKAETANGEPSTDLKRLLNNPERPLAVHGLTMGGFVPFLANGVELVTDNGRHRIREGAFDKQPVERLILGLRQTELPIYLCCDFLPIGPQLNQGTDRIGMGIAFRQ